MSRGRTKLAEALDRIPQLRQEFFENAVIPGSGHQLNLSLEKAGRIADFLELGELTCRDALAREGSCGCHLRDEHQIRRGRGEA